MNVEVCYVVNSVSETSVPATLAVALTEHENVDVDILAWFKAEPFEGDDRVGVEVLGAGSIIGMGPKTYRKARRKLEGYDLVQTHTNHSGAFAKVIASVLGIPLVSREGNTRDGFTRKGRIANGVTNALADRIVPNSQAVYESFRCWERLLIDEESVKIIPNGVDLKRIDAASEQNSNIRQQFGIHDDAVVVGTAAVLTEQKAIEILVEAIALAKRDSDREIHLVIVGDGPRRSEIEILAGDLGIAGQTHVTGMVSRDTVYRILNDIDIYAMPSRWEGFAMAAVEALGAGKSCLFSDIDPFVIPYQDVAMFHRVDDTKDLADQLVELVEDPEIRRLYGQKGRELVEEKYTIEQIAHKYAAMYETLV
jgi:glycosyltransferase involved in cell wall biosynthesis